MNESTAIERSPRILVIKLRYLGDVLLTTPVFDALKAHFPDAFLAAAVNRGTEDMLTCNPSIDKIFTVERDESPLRDLWKQLRQVREIRRFRFDLALDLTQNDRAAVLAWLSGARRRWGYRLKREKLLRRALLFTDLISPRKNLHILERHLEMARALGCAPLSAKPRLYWSAQDQRDGEELLRENGLAGDLPYIVLHPSSNALHKVWTAEGYAALCDALWEKQGVRTLLISGRDEEESRLNRAICALAKCSPLNLGGRLSLKQTAVLLSRAVLFVGIDSGPMHMATAVDTPVVAIFGPSRPWRWGPWGTGQIVVQKAWDCVPCGKKGCRNEGGESRCLVELTPEEVLPVVETRVEQILRQPLP